MKRNPEAGRTGLLLTLLSVLWLTVLRDLQGTHAHSGVPLYLSWLRDASLALPLVLAAVALSLRLGRLANAARLGEAAELVTRSVLLAVAASGALAATSPLHRAMFGAHDSLPAGIAMLREGLISFLVLLPMSLLVLGSPRLRMPRVRARQAALVILTSGVTVLAGAGPALAAKGSDSGDASGIVVPTATDPGNPCPAGAPQKSFDVQALDVNIPLNRFGDNDPQGKMYALTSAVSAIRAEEKSQQVSIGLRDDPIQPLVVRANLGDCVTFTFTNNATGGELRHAHRRAVVHHRLLRRRGRHEPAAPARPPAAPRSTSSTCPHDPTLEGAHYIHPGPGNRAAVDHGLFGALVGRAARLDATGTRPRGKPLGSGWEADIVPARQRPKSFREGVQMLPRDRQRQRADHATRPGRRPAAGRPAPAATGPARSR